MTVRCRFAPAPTGSLHVGNVRTALFSWLHARHGGGEFVLRVEDTDATRVTEEASRSVLDELRWLGLDWDEGPDVGGRHGPYRQSERLGIYRDMTARLLDAGDAYRCWCTPEELEDRRAAALARGEPPGYDGRCRTRTAQEIAGFEAEGRPFAIRFRMPEREWVVEDLVKGEVRWAANDLRDFVVVRSDGSPVFLLAVAVSYLYGVSVGKRIAQETKRQERADEMLAAPVPLSQPSDITNERLNRLSPSTAAGGAAATSAVASSHSLSASRYTTNTVTTPATAEILRLIKKNGTQLIGQLATRSATVSNDPAATPHA